jgi:hypothetical protein
MSMARAVFMGLWLSPGVSDDAVDVWSLTEVAKRALSDFEKYFRIVQDAAKEKIPSANGGERDI